MTRLKWEIFWDWPAGCGKACGLSLLVLWLITCNQAQRRLTGNTDIGQRNRLESTRCVRSNAHDVQQVRHARRMPGKWTHAGCGDKQSVQACGACKHAGQADLRSVQAHGAHRQGGRGMPTGCADARCSRPSSSDFFFFSGHPKEVAGRGRGSSASSVCTQKHTASPAQKELRQVLWPQAGLV